MAEGRLLDGGMLNRIILYVTAMMEVKSSMGVVVAAPTAGACAGLPGACIGAANDMGLSVDEIENIDPSKFRLFYMGQEVAIQVTGYEDAIITA